MATYWIMVFNEKSLGPFSAESLLEALKAVHFETLCDQYGLDRALIRPALDDLAVEMGPAGQTPFFLVRYQPHSGPPLVVSEWARSSEAGRRLLAEMAGWAPSPIREQLLQACDIYSVALVDSQLGDMGLLLGYELARWIAHGGAGLVLGLDGVWYRLNPHQAFIPLVGDEDSG